MDPIPSSILQNDRYSQQIFKLDHIPTFASCAIHTRDVHTFHTKVLLVYIIYTTNSIKKKVFTKVTKFPFKFVNKFLRYIDPRCCTCMIYMSGRSCHWRDSIRVYLIYAYIIAIYTYIVKTYTYVVLYMR